MTKPSRHQRVLFFCNEGRVIPFEELGSFPTSGTVSSMVVVAAHLASKGIEVRIAGPAVKSFEKNGVRFVTCPDERTLLEDFSRDPYDLLVVVGHMIEAVGESLRELSAKRIYWMHNWFDFEELSKKVNECGFEQVVCVSRFHLGFYLLKSLKQPRLGLRLTAIDNPVPADWFPAGISQPNLKEGIKVAFIGHPSKAKGFDQVIALMHALSLKTQRRCELHVFGDARLYRDSGLEQDVGPHTYEPMLSYGSLPREKLYQAIEGCHFAVSGLSGSETFCLSLVEAAGCGLVPVSINTGGQVSFLNSKNAVLAECVEGLEDKLLLCFEDPASFLSTRERALKLPLQFDPMQVAEGWSELLLGGPSRARSLCRNSKVLGWFLLSRGRRFFRCSLTRIRSVLKS